MARNTGHDLGHGVRVVADAGDGLVVQSAELDLGWRPRAAGRPGSAVTWQGLGFEVVAREPWRRGDRWSLEPWQGHDVMRVVLPLDREVVAAVARDAVRQRRASATRRVAWALLPVLGLAPGRWQRRWRDQWGFPATLATWTSALLECVTGAACLLQVIAMVGGGTPVFAWLPTPVAMVGMALFPTGLVRLAQVASDSEPVGSIVGALAAAFERRRRPPAPPVEAPQVGAWSEEGGELEMLSAVQRRDWEEPGLLRFRDRTYRLEATERLGGDWVYRFGEVADGDVDPDQPRLRLLPPREAVTARPPPPPPSVLRITLLTAAVSLAPRRYQERWAAAMRTRGGWFTAMGAGAELIGGLGDLAGNGEPGLAATLLGSFFVVEAGVRLVGLASSGRPVGSVLGLPLTPLLERLMPDV